MEEAQGRDPSRNESDALTEARSPEPAPSAPEPTGADPATAAPGYLRALSALLRMLQLQGVWLSRAGRFLWTAGLPMIERAQDLSWSARLQVAGSISLVVLGGVFLSKLATPQSQTGRPEPGKPPRLSIAAAPESPHPGTASPPTASGDLARPIPVEADAQDFPPPPPPPETHPGLGLLDNEPSVPPPPPHLSTDPMPAQSLPETAAVPLTAQSLELDDLPPPLPDSDSEPSTTASSSPNHPPAGLRVDDPAPVEDAHAAASPAPAVVLDPGLSAPESDLTAVPSEVFPVEPPNQELSVDEPSSPPAQELTTPQPVAAPEVPASLEPVPDVSSRPSAADRQPQELSSGHPTSATPAPSLAPSGDPPIDSPGQPATETSPLARSDNGESIDPLIPAADPRPRPTRSPLSPGSPESRIAQPDDSPPLLFPDDLDGSLQEISSDDLFAALERPPIEPQAIAGVTHIVRSGENFWTIARRYYGSGRFYRALWKANQDLVPRIDELYVGTRLMIPPVERLDRRYIDPPRRSRSTPESADSVEPVSDGIGHRSGTAPRDEQALRVSTPRHEPSDRVRRIRVHVTEPYETLRSIARKELGDSRRADELLRLNDDLVDDPNHLPVGVPLRIPDDR